MILQESGKWYILVLYGLYCIDPGGTNLLVGAVVLNAGLRWSSIS